MNYAHAIHSFLIAGRPVRSAAMPVLRLLTGPKMGFRPAGATHCSHKFAVRSPVPNLTFIGEEMWEYSPKTDKFFF